MLLSILWGTAWLVLCSAHLISSVNIFFLSFDWCYGYCSFFFAFFQTINDLIFPIGVFYALFFTCVFWICRLSSPSLNKHWWLFLIRSWIHLLFRHQSVLRMFLLMPRICYIHHIQWGRKSCCMPSFIRIYYQVASLLLHPKFCRSILCSRV